MTQEKLKRHLHFLTEDPNNISLLLEIYTLYDELGEQALASSTLEQAKALISTIETLEAKLLLARLLQRQGQLKEALDITNQIINTNPQHSEALGLASFLLFDLDEEQQAQDVSKRALAIDPSNYEANCIDILLRLKFQQTSIEEILALLSINPKDSRMLFALGNTYMAKGKMDLAEVALQQAVDLHPNFYDCLTLLAFCQVLTEKLDLAWANYQKATDIAKALSQGWSGLALVHMLRGEINKARSLLDKAQALNPDCFLAGLAEAIYFSYKNPNKAREQLASGLEDMRGHLFKLRQLSL